MIQKIAVKIKNSGFLNDSRCKPDTVRPVLERCAAPRVTRDGEIQLLLLKTQKLVPNVDELRHMRKSLAKTEARIRPAGHWKCKICQTGDSSLDQKKEPPIAEISSQSSKYSMFFCYSKPY